MVKRAGSAHSSTYNKAATKRFIEAKKSIVDLSSVYAVLPRVNIPMFVEYTYGATTTKVAATATVYRYKSAKELLSIFYGTGKITAYKREVPAVAGVEDGHVALPGVMGIPNHDEDGFCIVFRKESSDFPFGFGKFSYSPDGAESYMRNFFIASAIETHNRTMQRKVAYQAMTWELAPSAKTLLKIFFRKNEKPECEDSLPSVDTSGSPPSSSSPAPLVPAVSSLEPTS
jgi:hypothetical protein